MDQKVTMTDEEKFTQFEFSKFMSSCEIALTWEQWVALAKQILAADATQLGHISGRKPNCGDKDCYFCNPPN